MKNINESKQKINKYKKGLPSVYDLAEDGLGSDVGLPCYRTFCNWI
jgi:hypothetical protein